MKIEFRYYDKISCDRCAATDRSVTQSLNGLKEAMRDVKLEIDFKETRLPESKMHLSPSILIDGKDIEQIVNKSSEPKSNVCSDCCKLVGREVNCRTFIYKRRKYNHIPKDMILEAIRISQKTQ